MPRSTGISGFRTAPELGGFCSFTEEIILKIECLNNKLIELIMVYALLLSLLNAYLFVLKFTGFQPVSSTARC